MVEHGKVAEGNRRHAETSELRGGGWRVTCMDGGLLECIAKQADENERTPAVGVVSTRYM